MVYVLRFKKMVIIVCMLFISVRCNIPRDNILDPENPESYRSRKIVVEAFVNTDQANPYPYCQYMLNALDSLVQLYQNQIVVIEYHRNTESYQDDADHLDENEFLYSEYLNALGSSHKGVPDVFINGIGNRVQGASSISTAFFRCQELLIPKLSEISHFTLELDYQLDNGYLTPVVTIARLGEADVRDIYIRAVLIARKDDAYRKRVVQRRVESHDITSLKHGEIQKHILPNIQYEEQFESHLVVYVAGINDHIIYQSLSLEIG